MSRKIILTYHKITNNNHDNYLNTPISFFIQQINYLLESALTPLHLENLLKENKDWFLVTIDDGLVESRDWISFLEKKGIPYGLAIIASKIWQPWFLTIAQLKSLKFAEFYFNSLTHSKSKISDEAILFKEISESKLILENLLKKEIKSYVYPYGEYKNYNIKILKKHYQSALSLLPFHLNSQINHAYRLPRINIHWWYSFQKFKFLVSSLWNLYLHLAYLKRKFSGQSYLKY